MRRYMSRTAVTVVGLLFCISSAAHAAQTHIVRTGDTVSSIAARYQVSVGAIVAANRLTNPDVLALRQRLVIPTRTSPPELRPTSLSVLAPPRVIPSRGAQWASALTTRALRLVGIPYRWGGSTTGGFDCSGLISYVMALMGISVPRTTYALYERGQPIPKTDLQIGDVVFFQTISPGPSHAGIYIGRNAFIHSSSASRHVTVTSFDDRYYAPRYLGARRFN